MFVKSSDPCCYLYSTMITPRLTAEINAIDYRHGSSSCNITSVDIVQRLQTLRPSTSDMTDFGILLFKYI